MIWVQTIPTLPKWPRPPLWKKWSRISWIFIFPFTSYWHFISFLQHHVAVDNKISSSTASCYNANWGWGDNNATLSSPSTNPMAPLIAPSNPSLPALCQFHCWVGCRGLFDEEDVEEWNIVKDFWLMTVASFQCLWPQLLPISISQRECYCSASGNDTSPLVFQFQRRRMPKLLH